MVDVKGTGVDIKAGRDWAFWIDRGGTFTDIVGLAGDGSLHALKLLSSNPGHYADAAVEGMRRLMGLSASTPFPEGTVAAIHIGTTVATNALLERTGARTVLVTTKGLADQLLIGTQHRPKLFVRKIEKPPALYAHVIEVNERVLADGRVMTPLDIASAKAALEAARADGADTAAIVLMHGYRYPAHERILASLARGAGFAHVSVSHEVSPLIKFVERGDTTVADAYLTPPLKAYVSGLKTALGAAAGGSALKFMTSGGGLAAAQAFCGKDAVLSGPAGGIVGMAKVAALSGFDKVIGFDMGGTSTDVSRLDGTFERTFKTEVAGVRLRAPMLAIHTVAAGGGSILHCVAGRMRVGPDSAGSDPGPACYRRGGPLTVSDANLMTGRLVPEHFPSVFGDSGREPLNTRVVEEMFGELSQYLGQKPEAVADGFLDIAVANMAEAIKRISVSKGYDVRDYALNAFGGAAGQLACRVAQSLGMRTVLVHPMASLLSALGIGLADTESFAEEATECPLAQGSSVQLEAAAQRVRKAALEKLRAQGAAQGHGTVFVTAQIRYAGSDSALTIPHGSIAQMHGAFEAAHRRQFGFGYEGREIMIDSLCATASSPAHASVPSFAPAGRSPASALGTKRLYVQGAWREAALWARDRLDMQRAIEGPALIVDAHTAIVVEPGWQAQLDAHGMLILTLTEGASQTQIRQAGDPVLLEIAQGRFMSIAEQMGAVLEKTASSVNIKERLDFSCALFDAVGQLIANAPHMPVHLGSMGESVEAVRSHFEAAMTEGDVYVLNDPYAGGTHLPDITVVMPVFGADGTIDFYTAARGHHADIGGLTPGSMPPASKTIDDEGVLIEPRCIVHKGEFYEEGIRALLASGRYPARDPDRNIADLKAQIAACAKGAEELRLLARDWGRHTVKALMAAALDDAERQTRAVIARLKDGAYTHEMDDGARIAVALRVDPDAREAVIDFTGTSPARPNNFNAPRAVTHAAVLYAFRCLVESEIPLNAGCLRPLTIIVPEGSMLNPSYPAAIVAGNVETSQAVTDTIFAALGALAASQGTMNNVTFGDALRQYYETICGGAGAGPGFDGASAVQTHMTNSRLTDPEVLEQRFPVLLRRFAVRKGSGGRGRSNGGDGVERAIEFLEPMEAAILSTRRRTAPFGLSGGSDGALGRTSIRRADGRVELLAGCATASMNAGDMLIVETPGGGGFGKVEE